MTSWDMGMQSDTQIETMDHPITPGEILLEEYLKPMSISQNAMARAIGVSPRTINEIVHGKRSITPAMSIRFGAFFGQSDGFWHGIQVECYFRALRGRRAELVSEVRPAASLAAASRRGFCRMPCQTRRRMTASIRKRLRA